MRSAAFHAWGRSGDVHMGGSICAQWGASRGVRGGELPDGKKPSLGAFLQGGLGKRSLSSG